MQALSNTPAGAKAGLREWIGLAVLALPTLLVSIDVSVVILALPHIGAGLKADSTQQLWIMDIYSFVLAGFMVTMGTLGDRIGRRKLLMIGGAAFGLASILAAFSSSPEMLIVARALLGIAGATLSPSIMALITNMFRDDAQRGFALSVWLTCFMGGMVIGPIVGGVLLEQFWWGAVFLLGVPVMLLLLVTAPFLLPEYKAPQAGRIDLWSVVLSLLTILPAIYGLKEIARHGADGVDLFALAAGIGFGIVFARRQLTLADPLLDVKLFRNPLFSTAVGGMLMITLTGSMMLFTNQYLQLVLGLPPVATGLWTLPAALGSVVGFLAAPILAARIKRSVLIGGGLLLSVAGLGLVGVAIATQSVSVLALALIVQNLGCAPMVTLATGIVMGSVPPEKAGSAAAVNETCAEFGFALGIAAFGSLLGVIYRNGIAGNLPALPADQAALAGDNLAGAVAVAASLPANVGGPLLEAARGAYLGGFGTVMVIAGILLTGVAILALVMFRSLPPLGAGNGAAADGGEEPLPIPAE
jgi:DHA2 family multidrug resistance protein-like MFS transporter